MTSVLPISEGWRLPWNNIKAFNPMYVGYIESCLAQESASCEGLYWGTRRMIEKLTTDSSKMQKAEKFLRSYT